MTVGSAAAKASRILVVDDNETHADSLREGLERAGHRCEAVYTANEAFSRLERDRYDVLVTDLMLKESTGIDLMRRARRVSPATVVFFVTAHATVETAVRAMREGAADYIEKPVQIEELRMRIARVLETQRLREENLDLHRLLDKRFGFEGIVGSSPAMQKLFDALPQISPTDATVLLLGESGTGKELVAKAIHSNSRRKQGPFVAINCAALSESLIESELFGHEKGAFTGAVSSQVGKIEYAGGGTLFLDEVGDMPLATQVKLLRVLEQREILRVGSNKTIRVDVRLIAATNADLRERVKQGRLREDLFFRLNVITLQLPPLRERRTDIPLLIDHFLKELSSAHGRKIKGVAPEARRRLLQHPWPGNVRELRNCLESMVVVSRTDVLREEDLPSSLLAEGVEPPSGGGYVLEGKSFSEVERDLILANLALVEGNREKCAKVLGMGERTLYRKIKEYGL